jgi:cell pole-organizing protein PopZ
MEDLLTSIRQAINENVGLPTEAAEAEPPDDSGGATNPGAMPAEAEPAPSRADEIAALRNKIASQLKEPREPFLASLPRPSSRPGGFTGLLSGRDESSSTAEESPPLRSHLLDEESPTGEDAAAQAPVESFTERRYERSFSSSWNSPPRPAFQPRPSYGEPGLLSPAASMATNAAFGRLAESMVVRTLGDHTIEQMAQDLLRGMLKQWLDDNLPVIVERLVREEIERVARRGAYR